jgi:hypothetical protein
VASGVHRQLANLLFRGNGERFHKSRFVAERFRKRPISITAREYERYSELDKLFGDGTADSDIENGREI